MKKNILYAALLCVVSYMAEAQDLDPTVVVNRAYEGQLMEVHKPSVDMAVPDTVARFDLDFDYSVFEKPYMGAYEFNPYVLTMQPASSVQAPKRLYLKAGAGYTLHPTFDLVWSPIRSKGFTLDVYAMHRSYVGEYRTFKPAPVAGETLIVDRWVQSGGNHGGWKGYDLETRAGVDGGYDWKEGAFRFDLAYYGIAGKEQIKTRHYDSFDARFGVSSKSDKDTYFMYDIKAGYSFAEDNSEIRGVEAYLGEHLFNVNATVGQVLERKHNVLFDVGLDLASYSHKDFGSTAAKFHIVPHYVFNGERWSVDAGLCISAMLRSEAAEQLFSTKEQMVYPDVKAWFDVIPGAMRLYSYIGGGSRLNTYYSLLKENHHFDPSFGHGIWPVMDVTVERVSASLGLAGRIGAKFSYDLRGGYVNYKNALLDAVMIDQVHYASDSQYVAGFGYAPYQKLYAALDWNWKNESLRFDGNLTYAHCWGAAEDVAGLFLPSALTGDVAFEYNWSRRIYAGVDCLFATGRKGSVVDLIQSQTYEARIPGYADLGLYFEYAATRSLSFWLRGGNLLNMTIQRNPLYAEKGVNFTIGICLNL